MRVVRFIKRFWYALLGRNVRMRTGIDSHKWESKMEILDSLSSRRR